MVRLFILGLLLFSLEAKIIDGIAILVKEQPITLYDIEEQMREYGQDQQSAVDILIRKKLEENEARQRHISASSQEVYAEIEKIAAQNRLSVSQLYDAMYSSKRLTQSEFKDKIKEKVEHDKLFRAIASSKIKVASDNEAEDYYHLHKSEFSHPEYFDVIVYQAPSQELLNSKRVNPMFHDSSIKMQELQLRYNAIDPRFAAILNETEDNHFTQVTPSPQGGYMTFLLMRKGEVITQDFSSVKNQIMSVIMKKREEQILDDYFSRLQINADIKIIRLPNTI
ncbi:MAG: peptidyl-prolyl cis-trans isomerase [Campylobacterota bacterium]|nr:peptidyl-prolyl cis-trans isomerase [Campylobacterota bacterium]